MHSENLLLSKFDPLLQCIRGIGNEKPSVREENTTKFKESLPFFLKELEKEKDSTLSSELTKSLNEYLGLMLDSIRWEDRYAGLIVLESLLAANLLKNEVFSSLDSILQKLDDKEMRVRGQVSKIIAILSQKAGFIGLFQRIFPLVQQRCKEELLNIQGKFLETYLLALKALLINYEDPESLNEKEEIKPLIEFLKQFLPHQLKHIRVLALEILEILLRKLALSFLSENVADLLPFIENGLSDNMTEPRFQGTKTAGAFLLRLKVNENSHQEVFQRLLPRICFNRLYPAESFSKESLFIWKEIVGVNGKQILGSLISESIDYYLQESEKTNAEIRETACKGFQELMTKAIVNNEEAKAKLLKKIPIILTNLLRLAQDNYHLVREAAFSAILAVLVSENEIFLEKDHSEIFNLCIEYIGDSFHDSRRNVIEILGYLTEKNWEISNKLLDILDQKLKNKEIACAHHHSSIEESKETHSSHEHEPKKPVVHEHKGDLYDALVAYFKELSRIFSKNKPELIEKSFNLLQFHSQIFILETSAYVKENVWKNLTEGLFSAGRPFIKRFSSEILSFVLETMEKMGKNSGEGCGELLRRLQGILGANIMKAKVEGLNQGQWVKLYSENLKI